jgi:hypothetical protein
MRHLLVVWRWLKLLGDDAAENQQCLPASLVGKGRPQVLQA